jgi:hypothetical protein
VFAGPIPDPYTRRDSDVAPVLTGPCAGLAGVQAGVAGSLQKKFVGFPPNLISKKILRRFHRFVQGYIILKKCNKNIEEYSRKIKKITNQKTHITQRAHDQKILKDCTRSN